MAHHYKTPCSQCYRLHMCKKEDCDTQISEKRKEDFEKGRTPFIYYNSRSREEYRAKWNKNGQLNGMSNHDCFMGKNQFIQTYGKDALYE